MIASWKFEVQLGAYDELLGLYADRDMARERIRGEVSAILDDWQMPGTPKRSND